MAYEPEDRGPESGPGTDGARPGGGSRGAPRPEGAGDGRGRRPSAGGKPRAKKRTVMTIVNDPRALRTPAGLEIAEEAQALLAESNANTQALIDAINAIIRAETVDEVIRATLETIRKEFGWTYAS